MIAAPQIQARAQRFQLSLPPSSEVLLVDASESEPLLGAASALLAARPVAAVLGLRLAMLAAGARYGVFYLRDKTAARALASELRGAPEIQIAQAPSTYLAGDLAKHSLGLPNAQKIEVSALLALSGAMRDQPPVSAVFGVAGSLPTPMVLEAPIGTPLSEVARWARVPAQHVLWRGGPARGRAASPEETVTPDLKALLSLPKEHPLLSTGELKPEQELKRVASVCGGCRVCAELCPPRLLGAPIDPQKALLALAYERGDRSEEIRGALLCSGCGICEKYACPVGVRPASLLRVVRERLVSSGVTPPTTSPGAPSPELAQRQIPLERLAMRLGVSQYATPSGPIQKMTPKSVLLPLFGAVPVKKVGESVRQGDLLTQGAHPIYASLSGVITEISPEAVLIRG